MKKSKKKKLAKKSWKHLLGDSGVIADIRNIMMMQDYSKKQVRKAFKAAIFKFLEEEYVDDEKRHWAKKLGYSKADDEIDMDEIDDDDDDGAVSFKVNKVLRKMAGKKKK